MTGDVHVNTRALRQLGALSDAGLTVTVLALPRGGVESELPASVDLRTVGVAPGSGPGWFRAVHRAFSHALSGTEARLYHASDLYVLRAVRARARAQVCPFTYDARELYPHVAATRGRPLVRRFWQAFERGPAREAAVVWTVSDAIADHMAASIGIERPVVQFNAPVAGTAEPDPHLRAATGIPDAVPLFVHLGQMRRGRGGEAAVKAFGRVRDAALVFLGYGPERVTLERLASELDARDRIRFLDPVPPARLRSVVAGADVGVTLLEDTCLNHRYALPNKLFDYLAAGLPVLSSDLPEISRVVQEAGVGLTADASDPEALAHVVERMARDVEGRKRWSTASLAASETFDWTKASERFLSPIQNLLSGST